MHHVEHIWTIVVLKICKHTFNAYLLRIWKLMHFTRFIQKVFATKIMLSGKFSFFSDSEHLALGNRMCRWNISKVFNCKLYLIKRTIHGTCDTFTRLISTNLTHLNKGDSEDRPDNVLFWIVALIFKQAARVPSSIFKYIFLFQTFHL